MHIQVSAAADCAASGKSEHFIRRTTAVDSVEPCAPACDYVDKVKVEGVVLVKKGDVFFETDPLMVHEHSGLASQGGNPMNVTRVTVDHIRVVADKPFDQIAKTFEQQMGRFNEDVYKTLAAGEDLEKARAKLEWFRSRVGPR